MPVLDWLRPPRHVLALSILVSLAALAAMAWLGWELLWRERSLDAQRAKEALENAADRAVSYYQREASALEKFLSPAPDLSVPDDVVAFVADRSGFRVQPAGRIVYFPDTSESSAGTGDAFRQAETLEFSGSDPDKVITQYRSLAASTDSGIRGGALLRLGRTLRKADRPAEALQAYSSLTAMGAVRTAGLPAALVGREARCTVLAQMGGKEALARESLDLCAELASGRWQIPRAAWFFLREEAQAWLPTGSACAPIDDSVLAASATAEALWKRRQSLPATGQELSAVGSRRVLSVWAASPERLSAVLAGETFLEEMRRRAERSTGTQITLAGERLPWNLKVALPHQTAAAEFWSRQRILLASFTLACLLVLAGGYFTVHGIHRELAVAQLQSDFVAAVSHEFRTPLTSLRQISEMLAGGRLIHEDRRQRYYDAMVVDTGRLQRLVEELLNFGRMEAGVMRYRSEPVDVAEMAGSMAAGFQRLQLRLPQTPCPIRGDREALSLAVWNLLDNACKYSPDDSPVTLEVSRNGTCVAIAVQDQGCGIAPEEQKKIFKKFVRSASAVESSTKGTGIGLAIVNHVVKGHRGEVRLESEPGRGSTFTLLLPVGEES